MMIIYIAGLQNVPGDLIEAAADRRREPPGRRWRCIKLPMVMSSVTICLFLSLTNSFKLFDQNLSLTGGEPNHASEMLALNIYNTFYARSGPQWKGIGQAKAVVFFVLVVAIALVQLRANTLQGGAAVMVKAKKGFNLFWTVLLSVASVLYVYPILMILLNSFKKETSISTSTAFLPPTADTFAGAANYVNAISSKGFLQSLLVQHAHHRHQRGAHPAVLFHVRVVHHPRQFSDEPRPCTICVCSAWWCRSRW